MAESIMIQIRDEIIAAVDEVSTLAGFNTDNVTSSATLAKADMLTVEERQAHFSCRWVGRNSAPTRGNIYEATAQYRCLIKMENATEDEFALFVEDIEAAIAQRPIYDNVDGVYYKAVLTYVTAIDVLDVEELTDDRIQEALMLIESTYRYEPSKLSGVS